MTWNRQRCRYPLPARAAQPRARPSVRQPGSAAGLATIGRTLGPSCGSTRLYRPLRERDRVRIAGPGARTGHVPGLHHVRSNNCRLMSTPPLTVIAPNPAAVALRLQWLSKDDIRGVRHLYGRKTGVAAPATVCASPAPSNWRESLVRSATGHMVGLRVWLPGTCVVVETFDLSRCAGDVSTPPTGDGGGVGPARSGCGCRGLLLRGPCRTGTVWPTMW